MRKFGCRWHFKGGYILKRVGNLEEELLSMKNLELAHKKAKKNKRSVIRCVNNIQRLKIKYGDQYKPCSLNRGRAASYNGITMRCTSDKIKSLAKGMM